MKNQIKCPTCHKPVDWKNDPDRPFCSERCRLIDLGCWADQTYHIPGNSQDPTTVDNIFIINKEKKDTERS